MLAMVVEIMVTALTGAQFGAEADSFFVDAGNQPRLGQLFLVINPDALAGRLAYESRLSDLIDVVLQDPDVRLPGTRRFALAEEECGRGLNCRMHWLSRFVSWLRPAMVSQCDIHVTRSFPNWHPIPEGLVANFIGSR